MARIDSRLTFALLAGTALSAPGSVLAVELPTGGSVAYGGVAISQPSANALSIQQSTNSAIVNWQGFSIGQGGRVDISQPSASSAILNRVTGSTPSTIAGQLNANGQVYIVNPNGIAITSSGTVKAGGFVASTLGISDEDFKAGRRTFTGNGASAAVSNAGTIDIATGGYAALIGGRVDNSGTISVPLGRVGLGAGEQATLDLTGDGFLQVAVPSAPDGSTKALIENSGRIRANGGRVEMQAATARDMARQAINMSGVVEARTVSGRSGAIVLGGGAGGAVTVSGTLDASARTRRTGSGERAQKSAARGGSVTVTGNDIRFQSATVNASGPAGGGTVRIGGDYQGGGTLQRAATTTIDAASVIRADATTNGNGGSVVVWSDLVTTFAGLISAKGGPLGGNGGDAEVSGKALLNYTGLADLSAARGRFGTLLLDPYNVTISTAGDSNQNGFTATGNDSNINVTTLQNALATANVTVSTGPGGAQAGDITVAAPVTWAAATNLVLSAANNITVGSAINATGNGGLSLNAQGNVAINANVTAGSLGIAAGNTSGGPLPTLGSVTATGDINVGTFTLSRGNWVQNGATLPAFSAGNFILTSDGTSSFLRAAGGTGTAATPYLIADVFGLQGMGSSATLRASNFALANSIDASGTSGWNDGAGFKPIGASGSPFTGTFDGRNLTISNLFINRPTSLLVGLFGLVQGSTLQNVTLANVNITGGFGVGALAGHVESGFSGNSTPSVVRNVRSSGLVTGADEVGGLVGSLETGGVGSGTITQSTSSATIAVGGTSPLGSSSITSRGTAGGLVGSIYNVGGTARIEQSFATGNVTGALRAGGLVGETSVGQTQFGGGSGTTGQTTIVDSSASGTVQAQSGTAGGLIGNALTNANSAAQTLTVQTSFATGRVVQTSGVTTGGLIGTSAGNGTTTVTNSYWDTQTTGLTASAGGGTGQTTAQLQAGLPAGFSPAVWGSVSGASYPFLNWRYPNGVLVVSGTAKSANAFTPGTPIAGEPIALAAGGAIAGTTTSGANGYYYFAIDPGPTAVTVFRNGGTRGFSNTLVSGNAVTGLDVTAGGLIVTGQATASGLAAQLAAAGDSTLSANIPYTVPASGPVSFLSSVQVAISALNPAGFTINRSISAPGGLAIVGAVPPVTAAQIAAGTVTVNKAGPVTINSGQSLNAGTNPVIINTTRFTNNGGANALGALFRVYSVDFDNDARGGLTGLNYYNRDFNPLSDPNSAAPRLFVYTRQPILTVTANDGSRPEGVAGSGFAATITGLVNGDAAATSYSGSPTVTDSTALSDPGGTYPGALVARQGSLASSIGYGFRFVNGTLTIIGAPQQQPQGPDLQTDRAVAVTQPTLARQLPLVFAGANTYPDTIDLNLGGGNGGGPTLGTGVTSGGASSGSTRSGSAETLSFVQRSSRDLERQLNACDRLSGDAYKACVGNALDRFSADLDTRALQLPAPLRNVTAVIRQAAQTVRTARTKEEARAAVRVAIGEVRKAIALIRADDPVVARNQVRQGNAIASALQTVDNKLARAVGL